MTILNENFETLETNELENIDGGVAPVIVFLGKAALSGIGFGLGYWGIDTLLN